MSSDFLAAKDDDPLVHASIWADLASGIVKGAIYAAIGLATAAAIGLTGGAALAVGVAVGAAAGFVLGEAIDAVADAAGDLVDDILSFFGKSPPEGVIVVEPGTHGRVRTKSKLAARAAGAVPGDIIRAELEMEQANPPPEPEQKGWAIAKDIFYRAVALNVMLSPMGPIIGTSIVAGMFANNKAEPQSPNTGPEPIPSPQQGFWEGLLTPIATPKHPFASPKDNDKIICTKWHMFPDLFLAEGSKKVLINDQPACRNGDRSTCEAKIDHQQDYPQVRIGGPTLTVRDIKSGKNPFMSMLGEILGGVAVGLASLGRQGLRACLKEAGCMLIKEAVGTALSSVVGGMIGQTISRMTASGNPVHHATGAKILHGDEELDFVLEGQIPLIWQRIYNSRNPNSGLLGLGWSLPFEVSLHIEDAQTGSDEDNIIFTDMSGRELGLGAIALGQSVYFFDEGFRLYRSEENLFLLETNEGEYTLFEANPLRRNYLRVAQTFDRHQQTLFYHYNSDNQLTHIYDEHRDVAVRLAYHPEHQRLLAVYQQNNELERLLVEYDYNSHGELITVKNAEHQVTRRFLYGSEHHLMVMHQYATGLQAHYRWQQQQFIVPDLAGTACQKRWYVVEHWLQDDTQRLEEYQFNYDVNRRHLTITETGIGSRYVEWDSHYSITHYTNELGEQWQLDWSEQTLLEKITDPLGGEYTFSYDERGNITCITNPLGQKELTEWDKDFAFPLSKELPNGAIWRYHYNQQADLIKTTAPDQLSTKYVYDGLGNLLLVRDPKGNEYTYQYNHRGQLIKQTDCSGQITRINYDDWGQLESVTDASGASTYYTFSAAGLLQKQTLADGRSQAFEYDQAGQLIRLTDFAGHTTQLQRNLRGQVTQHLNPQRHKLQFIYDRRGRLQQLVNEKGEAYQFEYDALHRLQTEHDLTGQKKVYQYDALSNLTTLTHYPNDAAAGTAPLFTHFERNAIGQMTAKISHDYRTEYHYATDKLQIKRFSRAEWAQAQLEQRPPACLDELLFDYDIFGQVTAEHNHSGSYHYHYDPLGNLLSARLPDKRELHHLYYGSGHLQQTNLKTGELNQVLAEFERDNLHREINRSQGALAQRTEYDATGRITAKIARLAHSSHVIAPVIDKRYRYDAQNNLIERISNYGKTDQPFLYGPRETEDYHYDVSGQITQRAKGIEQERFSYDAAANLFSRSAQLVSANQLMGCGEYRYQYDGFGRMVQRTHRVTGVEQTYDYDSEHRLIRVQFKHHRTCQQAQYHYDALGRRTKKQVWHHQQTEPVTTTFSWQGMRMSGEQCSARPYKQTLYFYNQDSYEPLARLDQFTYPDKQYQKLYYYHTHLNGLPEEMTDEQGNLLWRGEFSLWGKTLRQRSETYIEMEQNLRFQGQYFDEETGLHYNTFRYYDPEIGRFTQQDPIGLAGGLNLYQYAPNPVMWVDPWGLSSCILAKNMEKNGTPRPDDSAAHHIVGDTSKKADPARAILNSHGIDVDDAVNGVFLPNRKNTNGLGGILHNGKHPDKYFEAVNKRIRLADIVGGKQEVLKELGRIKDILSNAGRNDSWYTILQ